MDHANQVQVVHLHAHQKFVMKLQIHTQLMNNVNLIILHVKQMEEVVKLLFLVEIIKQQMLVQLILHVYGQLHVELHLHSVHH